MTELLRLTDLVTGLVGAVVTVTAPLVVAAALLTGALALLRTRSSSAALGIVLDLFLVVGLLRLSATATWQSIVTAAAIVAIRKVVALGLARGRRALEPAAPGTGSP